jgi:hypothetical protein
MIDSVSVNGGYEISFTKMGMCGIKMHAYIDIFSREMREVQDSKEINRS